MLNIWQMQEKNEKKSKKNEAKPQIRFQVEEDFRDKIFELSEKIGFSVSEIGVSAMDYFLHLGKEDQIRVLAYHRIWDALRIDPKAHEHFPGDSAQLLDYVAQQVKSEGEK